MPTTTRQAATIVAALLLIAPGALGAPPATPPGQTKTPPGQTKTPPGQTKKLTSTSTSKSSSFTSSKTSSSTHSTSKASTSNTETSSATTTPSTSIKTSSSSVLSLTTSSSVALPPTTSSTLSSASSSTLPTTSSASSSSSSVVVVPPSTTSNTSEVVSSTSSASETLSSASTSTVAISTTSSSTVSTSSATPTYNAFSCPSDLPLSCQNTTVVDNLCCFNYPGGSLLQTQFWDTNPVTGPNNSWTIHGLWPDNCDGTYESTCDPNRQYTNITQILQAAGRQDLVDYMTTFWVSDSGTPESFWEHEWGKHGTCISTFDPPCYSNYQPTLEVPDFFNRTVSLFKSLPSYDWLTAAGIVPSSTVTYTVAQIQAALASHHNGYDVYLGCSGSTLSEIWYYFNVQGSIQTGSFVPAAAFMPETDCPATGVKYLPKVSGTATATATGSATATSAAPTPTNTGPPFTGAGYLRVYGSDGTQEGFVISAGTWYNTAGTPATITSNSTTGTDAFTLKSSKGLCAVSATTNAFSCAAANTVGSLFTTDGTTLQYAGSNAFSAQSVPSGTVQGTIYAGAGQPVAITLRWDPK